MFELLTIFSTSNIWVYLGVSVLIILIGIVVNYFFNKFDKLVDIQENFHKTLVKLEILITKFDNHLEQHTHHNQNYKERRNFCDKKHNTLDYQVREIEKQIEILKNK